jgi:RNA polymerase sigma-70 factor (ECF subfamily)
VSGEHIRIEELLARADWVRGLVRHLAGQDGDDLVHDAWLAARRSPPAAHKPANAWLARVLRNLVHIRRRNDARRTRRERTYLAAQDGTEPAVDEVYERLELHRFLAECVMGLEEPLRVVVVLHYFEGLDSARIGVVTGTPPGTVRWRLKVALERLRASLDARHGGARATWLAILAAPRPGDAGGKGLVMAGVKVKAMLLSSLLALLLLLGGGATWWWARRAPARSADHVGTLAAVTGPSSSARSLPRLLPNLGASAREPGPDDLDLDGCRRALDPARELARAREREARGLVPAVAFSAGAPNPALRNELGMQLDRLLREAPATRHIECRAWACRVSVIVPNEGTGEVEPWLHTLGRWLPRLIEGLPGLTLTTPTPLGLAQQWGGGATGEDILDRRKTEQFVFFVGAPPGGVAPLETAEPAAPPRTAEDCRRELEGARAATHRLELQLAGFQAPTAAFAAAPMAPSLSAKIRQDVDESLGAGQAIVECRGSWCRLRFPQPPSAETLARLRAEGLLRGSLLGARRIEKDVYMLVREDAFGVLRRMREPMHEVGFFQQCAEAGAAGSLVLRIAVPATGDVNDRGVPGRASVRAIGGDLEQTRAGACLVERLEGLLAVDLPAPINGALRLERWTWRPGEAPVMSTPE